jgi:hypothetical protein
MEDNMRKIRFGVFVLWMVVCCSVTSAPAEVSIGIGIGLPNLSIGINLPLYPELVPVPGYPVYYAPQVNANYFFYDGMYWVYQNDYWYASSWYNGPWALVAPEVVPVFILRIPVRYYRHAPAYFRGWRADAPPRWGEHWGRGWEQQRRGWDTWQRGSAPARAPLPRYQREYSGGRYPRQVEQQRTIHSQHYRYQPRDQAVRQHYQQQGVQRPAPPHQGGPAGPHAQQPPPQQRGPAVHERVEQPMGIQRGKLAPIPQGQEQRMQEERGRPQEPGRGQGEGQRREEQRGR